MWFCRRLWETPASRSTPRLIPVYSRLGFRDALFPARSALSLRWYVALSGGCGKHRRFRGRAAALRRRPCRARGALPPGTP